MIYIKGLVVPYNVTNSYGETLLPGALADFLRMWKASGKPIPMMYNHKWLIGAWTGFVDKAKGLYLRGRIEDTEAQQNWRRKHEGMGASITWMSGPFAKLEIPNSARARGVLNRFGQPEWRRGVPVNIKRTILAEVSLTGSPSFPLTWVKECDPPLKEAA